MPVTEVEFNAERHEYRHNGVIVPHVTAIIAAAGKCDYSYVEEEIRQHSLKRGTSVHWMTQLEDEGALDYRKVPKRLRGYRRAWLAWKQASGFMPTRIEQPFISPRGFAGTIDRVGSFPSGSTGIIDIKTGPIQNHVRYQLAAYSLGLDDRFWAARNIRRVAVQLKSDGSYNVKEWPRETFDGDVAEFLEAVRNGGAGGEGTNG